MTLPPLIRIDPNPIPSAPYWVLVCYDFSQGATSPVILHITFPGTPFGYKTEVDKDEPCTPVYVPAGADGVNVTDDSAQSQDAGAQVVPD